MHFLKQLGHCCRRPSNGVAPTRNWLDSMARSQPLWKSRRFLEGQVEDRAMHHVKTTGRDRIAMWVLDAPSDMAVA